ncbi:MAG TPA: metallophosphoesterase [Saprospiraceae bacterium]|nr:metallophosphoesterase [Saprospiraceae bacterium]
MLSRLFSLLLLGMPLLVNATGDEPNDASKADTDGPHVFYRGSKIQVKYILRRDSGVVAKSLDYANKKEISLTCQVPKTGDSFSFLLKDELQPEACIYPAAPRILALSDIEGDFLGFKTMLQGAGVIDASLNWSYGDGHLVLLGDYFDRGLQVTECLWLIYKLESEAEAAGGKVHFILGNHEILNLQGNSAYVRRKYLENARLIGEDYKVWFDRNSELGRWLRTKNAIEKVGDYVFCHGGISPELARTRLSLAEINKICRQNLGKAQEDILSEQAKAVFDLQTGIFWYRGAARNLASDAEITYALQFAGAKRMVIGHTLQPDLTANYHGRVICIDLYHEENLRQGFMKTLLIEDGFCYSLNNRGEKSSLFSVSFPRKSE